MDKISEVWKKSPVFNRIAMIVTLVLSAMVIILSILSMQEKITRSFLSFFTTTMLSIITFLNGLVLRKVNQKVSNLILVISCVILMCAFLILIIKVL